MKIKGFLKDILGSSRAVKRRKEALANANGKEIPEDHITNIARKLHPGKISAKVVSIIKETSDSVRIRFVSPFIPLYKAGTYLTVELQIQEAVVTRAYSIITSPKEAYENKYVEIIVKDYQDGFVSSYLNHNLKVDDEVILEIGLGFFYIDEFRDSHNIVGIAGGAGITPFIAIAHDIKENNLPYHLLLLYGSNNPEQIIAKKELEELQCENIQVVDVISGNHPSYQGEKGFIDRHILQKYALDNPTYFVCGPKIMYDLVLKELEALKVDTRRVRHEAFSFKDATTFKDFPKELLDKEFDIEVHQGIDVRTIKAKAKESILVALERNGYRLHSSCRSGGCGFCRIKIKQGTYFIPEGYDHRRHTDKEYNYVHSCSTFPTSDLVIKINIM